MPPNLPFADPESDYEMEVDLPYSDIDNGADSEYDEGPTQRTRLRAGRWQPSPRGSGQADHHDDSHTVGGTPPAGRDAQADGNPDDDSDEETDDEIDEGEPPMTIEEQRVNAQLARDGTQALIDAELTRIDNVYDSCRHKFLNGEEYKNASRKERDVMDRDFEDEYNLIVNNVFWCLKQEYSIRTGVSLTTKTSQDGVYEYQKKPTSTAFKEMDRFQGFFPELVTEIRRRHLAIRNNPPIPVHTESEFDVDARHDLVAKPPTYTFTEIRQKLGIAGTLRHKWEDDKLWKEFRRQVRKEIMKACIRSIKKSEQPGRWHDQTLSVAKKILRMRKTLWNATGFGLRKQEEMAYWLVTRELSLTGEAAGFGEDEDGPGSPVRKVTKPIRRPVKGLPSGRLAREKAEELRSPRKRRNRSSSIIRARDVSDLPESDSDQPLTNSHLSEASKTPSRPKRATVAALKPNASKVTKKSSPITSFGKVLSPKGLPFGKTVGVDLAKWRASFEIKALEHAAERATLEAAEKQHELSEQARAFEEKYGQPYNGEI